MVRDYIVLENGDRVAAAPARDVTTEVSRFGGDVMIRISNL